MDTKPLLIGDLARIAGVTPRTIRHYESLGLVPPPRRGPSGYRHYEPPAVLAIAEIRRLRALGMSLSDIAAAGHTATAPLVATLQQLKADIDREIADLGSRRRALDELERAVANGEAILGAGEPRLFGPVRTALIAEGASEDAVAEARRIFSVLGSLDLPESWATVIDVGLGLVREDACLRRAWIDALELVAQLRSVDAGSPVVSEVGHRIAALASFGADVRSGISFKDATSVAIVTAVASCFTPAQIGAFLIAAAEVGVLP